MCAAAGERDKLGQSAQAWGGGTRVADKRNEFGNWLRSWRHQARLTQQQLAADLGYDVTYIVKLEGGARPPTRQLLARLGQLVGQPVHDLLQASAADVSRPPLPRPPGTLVGRDAEVGRLVELLTVPGRCVTLLGPPGIGKSRLAMEVAAAVDAAVEGGTWWVSLLEVADAPGVASHLQRSLQIAGPGGTDPVDAVADRLGSRRSLLALDNFEHVLGARPVVSRLLDRCRGLSVLVTSREPLGLAAEHCMRIPPLAHPDPVTSPGIDEVRASPAVQLFEARARMVRADFRLTPDNASGVLATCEQLEGVPLSIVLAAGEVATTAPDGIAQRLREGRRPLAAAPADLPAHHRSVDAAIAASWDALKRDERELLAAVAVFHGGFTAAAARAAGSLDEDGTDRLLASLVRRSLVEARPDAPAGARFELLDSVRTHALGRLQGSGRFAAVQRRHLDHMLALAKEFGSRFTGPDQARAVLTLDAERENLGTAFEWALGNDPDAAVALAASLWRYFLKDDIPTGRRWLAQALGGAIEESPARAVALAGAGALAWVSGDPAGAVESLSQGAKLAERLELPGVLAVIALNEAALAEQQDRLDDAKALFSRARMLYEQLGDRRGRASSLTGQGVVSRREGDLESATGLWAEALGLFRAGGDRISESMVLGNLARAAEDEGRFDAAETWNATRQRIQVALGDARGLAATTAALGRLAHRRGEIHQALALDRDALVAFHRLGDRPWAASTLLAAATVVADGGFVVEALMLAAAADALWDGMGARPRGEEEDRRNGLLAVLEVKLGAAAFAGMSRAGGQLTLEEAVKIVEGLAGRGG